MSNYKARDMIRLTREAKNLSQEELCDGICSPQTLSRIENGKVRVKKETYQKLMQKMGRTVEKSSCILTVQDYALLDTLKEADAAIIVNDYETARMYLNQVKPQLDMEHNVQMIGRRELLIQYRLHEITAEELLKKLEHLISLSVEGYKKLYTKIYPFKNEEVQLLMNLAMAYALTDAYDEAIAINQMLIKSLRTGYMEENQSAHLILLLSYNTAKMYGAKEEHQMAIDLSFDVLKQARKYMYITTVSNAYCEIAWNMMEQIKKGDRDIKEQALCKTYLRQSYAAAALSDYQAMKKTISDYYMECFNEKIYDSSPYDTGDSIGL